MPDTSGPPAPKSRPSASSLAKPKPSKTAKKARTTEPECITISDDEDERDIEVVAIVRKPAVPRRNDALQLVREVAALVLGRRDAS